MPFISNISSMARWCLLLSFFSQTSVKKHKSVSLTFISSARLLILDQIDLMLYSETAGRDTGQGLHQAFVPFYHFPCWWSLNFTNNFFGPVSNNGFNPLFILTFLLVFNTFIFVIILQILTF